MFSQTYEQAPPTRPVIFWCFSQTCYQMTVPTSWRIGSGQADMLPLSAPMTVEKFCHSHYSQFAPPRYSQPHVTSDSMIASSGCD
jgi:hypothetical protein